MLNGETSNVYRVLIGILWEGCSWWKVGNACNRLFIMLYHLHHLCTQFQTNV